jgi:hypothetical protein
MIKIALSIHDKKTKASVEYFEFAKFCLDQLSGSLKGLSLMCMNVRPANIT